MSSSTFFSRFYPRVIDVLWRDRSFWMEGGRPCASVVFESTSKRNFIFVVQGGGALVLNGDRYSLSAGCLFSFPLRSRAELMTSPEEPLLFYSVHYDYKLVEWNGQTLLCSEPEEDRLPIPIVTQMPDYEGFSYKMRQCYAIWHGKNADYEWKARLSFLSMINEVCELYEQRDKGDHVHRAINQTVEYIKAHFSEPLERERLAEIASLSVSYYSIMFKKVIGCTPTQFVTKIRVDKAKHLLLSSGMTVSEVAREVGFQDPLYFARVFSNHTGIPPREYRKA